MTGRSSGGGGLQDKYTLPILLRDEALPWQLRKLIANNCISAQNRFQRSACRVDHVTFQISRFKRINASPAIS